MIERRGSLEMATYRADKHYWVRDYCLFICYPDEVTIWWSLDPQDGNRPPNSSDYCPCKDDVKP